MINLKYFADGMDFADYVEKAIRQTRGLLVIILNKQKLDQDKVVSLVVDFKMADTPSVRIGPLKKDDQVPSLITLTGLITLKGVLVSREALGGRNYAPEVRTEFTSECFLDFSKLFPSIERIVVKWQEGSLMKEVTQDWGKPEITFSASEIVSGLVK